MRKNQNVTQTPVNDRSLPTPATRHFDLTSRDPEVPAEMLQAVALISRFNVAPTLAPTIAALAFGGPDE